MMNFINATIENDIVRVWVELETGELLMLKLGTAKSLGIEDVKQLEEKQVFEFVNKFIADRDATQAQADADMEEQLKQAEAYADEQKLIALEEKLALLSDPDAVAAEIATITDEKVALEQKIDDRKLKDPGVGGIGGIEEPPK